MASTGVNVRVILPDSAARPCPNPEQSTTSGNTIIRAAELDSSWTRGLIESFTGFAVVRPWPRYLLRFHPPASDYCLAKGRACAARVREEGEAYPASQG